MARKTFISYKYSEAKTLRDRILTAMGENAVYYQGETSDSPNVSDLKTESIKNILKDMMYDTSVTIVIISPNIKSSKWIDWEISYTLKEISRNGRTSKTNGILGVIMNVNGNCSWFRQIVNGNDGHSYNNYKTELLYNIINRNRFNQNPKKYICQHCQTIDEVNGNYFSFVNEDDFIKNIDFYVENAYSKSQNLDSYDIVKEI